MIRSLFGLWRNYPRTSGNESVALSPGHFHGGRTAAHGARPVHLAGTRQDHPGGSGGAVFHRALVLLATAPGRDGEPDRRVKEAAHGLERIEPDRMRIAEFTGPLKESLLDLLEHRGDGDGELAQGH